MSKYDVNDELILRGQKVTVKASGTRYQVETEGGQLLWAREHELSDVPPPRPRIPNALGYWWYRHASGPRIATITDLVTDVPATEALNGFLRWLGRARPPKRIRAHRVITWQSREYVLKSDVDEFITEDQDA